MPSTTALLRRLAALAWRFGPDAARDKLDALERLGARPLASARQVKALHEVLCLWRAYPDDEAVLAAVERRLRAFAARADVRGHRDALESSGIAGCDIVYPFGAPTAQWLAETMPGRLSIAWDRMEDTARLGRHLLLVAGAAEVPGFDEPPIEDVERWTRHLAGPSGDAAFVIRGTDALPADTLVRDRAYEELDLPVRIAAGPASPSRTLARWDRAPVVFQRASLDTGRPDLRVAAHRRPLSIREASRREAEELVRLAHEAMVTRERDLDAFASADPRDVRLVEWDGGLQFACLGVLPERRFVLEAVYAFLTLRNGVPIGYALASALFGSSELAYNVFETFRGGEAAQVYGRFVATVRVLFGSDTFSIFPYQLGHENDEGLQSGAWWFYYKLGFRPRNASLQPAIDRELAAIGRRPGYRTGRRTLERLVAHPVFLSLGPARDDVIGVMPLAKVGLAVTALIASRFDGDRARAEAVLVDEAAHLLRVSGWRRWSAGERLLWRRWAPLVCVLPGVERWVVRDRSRLAAAIRAKGSARESDAIALLTAHRPFRRALGRLMGSRRGVLDDGKRSPGATRRP